MLARRPSRRWRNLRGFTLVEMLVAMLLTLIMVWAIAEFYARVGDAVKDGRAMIEMRSQMRTATQRLDSDLDLLTLTVSPPADDLVASGFAWGGPGYFEYREGICSDPDPEGNGVDVNTNGLPDIGEDTNTNGIADFVENNAGETSALGDIDDWLGFTIRSSGQPFVATVIVPDPSLGSISSTSVAAANTAEVVWWTSFSDNPLKPTPGAWDLGEPRALNRRLLLVRPDANTVHPGDPDNPSTPYYFHWTAPTAADAYYQVMQMCDVSIRYLATINTTKHYFAANSLSDLTRRENRFMHFNPLMAQAFPNPLDLNPNYWGDATQARTAAINNASQFRWALAGPRRGEEVILPNTLAFDVRLFDPAAVLRFDNVLGTIPPATAIVKPGDAGYGVAVTGNHPIAGQGAYVDLFYSRYVAVPTPSIFSSGGLQAGLEGVYDTWAASYERDGLNQDYVADGVGNINTAPFDEGTDGIDTNGANGVDDRGERETTPPYPINLRGIEVMIRAYEPGTRQVQQATVGADFIPE